MMVDTPPIYKLPTEILDQIFSSANRWQLATLRQVCRQWRCIVDQPSRWQRVSLLAEQARLRTMVHLWTLDSLRYLLNPHLDHIQSITLSGARDATVRFILTHCHVLETLKIMSWNTLSHYSLALHDHPALKLRHFSIIGSVDQFFAVDAASLAHFILHCPTLHHLSINHCNLCIHPDLFLEQLQGRLDIPRVTALTTMILSSLELPWSRHQVEKLLVLCPRIQYLRLESKSNTTIIAQELDSKIHITVNGRMN